MRKLTEGDFKFVDCHDAIELQMYTIIHISQLHNKAHYLYIIT